MLSNEFLHKLSNKATKIFPAAASMQKEIEANIYKLLQNSFASLNLVTREEFDSQLAVLQRAENTIAELERKVMSLEDSMVKEGDQTFDN